MLLKDIPAGRIPAAFAAYALAVLALLWPSNGFPRLVPRWWPVPECLAFCPMAHHTSPVAGLFIGTAPFCFPVVQ